MSDPVSGLFGALGSIGGGLISSAGQRATNASNERIAQQNRDFQERMSSTAYQRSMADMKSAGLNPMLAYMQGGASSPQGAGATMENPDAALGRGFSEATGSAMSAMLARKELALKDEQIKTQKYEAESSFNKAQTSQFEYSFPNTVVGGSGSNRRTIGETFWGQQRLAEIAAARANASSAGSQSQLTQERLPWERLKSAPGRIFSGIGRLLLGGGAERPGTSAWQRWTEGNKSPSLRWRIHGEGNR